MLSFLKRKQELMKQEPTPQSPAPIEPSPAPIVRRGRQQNIKVSEDCAAAFTAIAEAQGFSKAALFEDMVAERLQQLERQGVKLIVG